jgi:hypothetical protein
MDDVELKKGTRAAVRLCPYFGPDGGIVAIVIIKELFGVDVRQQVGRLGDAEIRLVDAHWDPDAPETSSIRLPSDLVPTKPSTDVLVVGSATAPGGKPVRTLDVFARVGSVEKTLRVHGTRVWYHGARGLALSAAQPFEAVPLRWELAFGGADFSDPKHPLEEPRNPIGRGVCRHPRELVEKPGPQIEDPRDPVGDSRHPAPAGVGVLGRHWEPRRRYVGTYDDAWMKARMPLPPLDFDPRFHQVAPPDQITAQPLRGGELVQLHNMNPHGSLQFALPRLQFFVGARTDDGMTEHRPALDTVVLLPGTRQLEMTWRAAVPLPKRASRLRFVQVHEKALV